VMRRALAKGTPRDTAIVQAVKARATYQAIADELGLTRQRVQQIIAKSRAERRPSAWSRRGGDTHKGASR